MYAVGTIRNTRTGRLHVAYFTMRPFPGGRTTPIRWQSRGHHTAGATTREEAAEQMEQLKTAIKCDDPKDLGDLEWDGEGVPAMMVLG